MKKLWILCVTIGWVTAVSADPIVFWGGDYVSSTVNLSLPTPSTDDNTRTWAYSDTTALSPSAGYAVPADRSGTFYGALQTVGSDNPVDFTAANVGASAAGDFLRFTAGGASMQGLIFFRKNDFLAGSSGSISVADLEARLLLDENSPTDGTFRFAVLDGTSWYISQYETGATVGGFTQSLNTVNWAAWDPTSGAIPAVPATFETEAADLTDVQAIGFYFNAARTSQDRVGIREFEVIPEPGTLGLLALGVLGLMTWRRTRK